MKKITAIALLSLVPYSAFSQVFKTDITVQNPGENPVNKKLNFDVANDFFDELKNSGFERRFPNYSIHSTVTAKTVYNGLPIDIIFPTSDSTTVRLSIPELGVNKTFTGATRGKSTKALENYIRNDTDGTYTKIVEYQVANSGGSQLAGNPGSLQGTLLANNFNSVTNIPMPSASTATTTTTTTGKPAATGGQAKSSYANPLLVGVAGGTYTQGGTDVSIISVPISKSFEIDSSDPRKKVLLNGQFNYVTVGQGASFQGSVGVGYMQPITDNWYLVPNISYGAIGSQDLATLGQIFSSSIASNYQHRVGDYTLSMINMFGYYTTLPLNVKKITSDPDINNYVIKNGFFASRDLPFKVFDHRLNVKGIFTDTEFFGSKVFVRQYNEVGFEFNTLEKVRWLDTVTFGMADSLTFSAKYVFSIEDSSNFEGYDIGIGYDF